MKKTRSCNPCSSRRPNALDHLTIYFYLVPCEVLVSTAPRLNCAGLMINKRAFTATSACLRLVVFTRFAVTRNIKSGIQDHF